ncbi:MAG: hypothetical protein ACTSWC_07660 [Promethearchaeota archaeon]
MIHIILVDTALERIPENIKQHQSVRKNLEKYKRAGEILDVALHHGIIKTLPESEKRGRPDILFHFILDTSSSILNLHKKLGIHFHGPDGFFTIESDMRCPRDYIRFKGLMAQLLDLEHIPPQPPYLIFKRKETLSEWLKSQFKPESVFLLSENGKNVSGGELQNRVKEKIALNSSENIAFLVGGFQKGEFSTEIRNLNVKKIAFSSHPLNAWTVVNRLLVIAEMALEL